MQILSTLLGIKRSTDNNEITLHHFVFFDFYTFSFPNKEMRKMKAFFCRILAVIKTLVGLVQKKLTQANAWYDAVDIENGESIPEKINDGLRNATHYVFVFGVRRQVNHLGYTLN